VRRDLRKWKETYLVKRGAQYHPHTVDVKRDLRKWKETYLCEKRRTISSTHSVFSTTVNFLTRKWCSAIVCGSLKLLVSFAKESYKGDHILQKRPIISRSQLIAATPQCVKMLVINIVYSPFNNIVHQPKADAQHCLVAFVVYRRCEMSRVAVCCSALQRVAACCSGLQSCSLSTIDRVVWVVLHMEWSCHDWIRWVLYNTSRFKTILTPSKTDLTIIFQIICRLYRCWSLSRVTVCGSGLQ